MGTSKNSFFIVIPFFKRLESNAFSIVSHYTALAGVVFARAHDKTEDLEVP